MIPQDTISPSYPIEGSGREEISGLGQNVENETPIRLNPLRMPENSWVEDFKSTPIIWSDLGKYWQNPPDFRQDPYYYGGVYFPQKASSMFLEYVIKKTINLTSDLRVLELNAGNGENSTLIAGLLSPGSLLVSNDSNNYKVNSITSNLGKLGLLNTWVTQNNPGDFQNLAGFFDVLLINGNELLLKEVAEHQGSESNTSGAFQKELLDAWDALQEQGVLIYTGNTGSAEQHLNVLEWMKEEFGIRNLPLEIPETFKDWKNFVLNEFKSEKQIVSGFCLNKTEENESFFVAVFRKTTAQRPFELRRTKPQINKNRRTERGMLGKWIKNIEEYTWFEKKGNIYLINPEHENILRIFQQNFQLIKAGLNAGKFAGGDLVPEHELAYSEVLGDQIQKVGLNTEEALKYIRREDFQIDRTVTGWVLISYRNCPLGWAKILSNRINNYYPKEQRMVKDA